MFCFQNSIVCCCPVPNQPPSCAMTVGHHYPQTAIHRHRAAPPIHEPSARHSCQIRKHLHQDPFSQAPP
ncbi:hypothetical protein EUGRSUZ_B02814 [Eucalyptus grandis]|uniref:Uncharacterized protein n=2 Tax=Eucalyptus grandis TaxID=71139 RepID=A0ACC3M1D2_EUCGR|nr:hypothetical protein EUGRSUZ_B02814 [Eucalyptus grandis]